MNNASVLIGKTVNAPDGEIGSVADLYFDERTWAVRYLAVDTAKWLTGTKVLLAPETILKPWHHEPALAVTLTTEQVQSSPNADMGMPISRAAGVGEDVQTVAVTAESLVDSTVQSASELAGYHVKADDGEVGQVEDLLLDDDLSRILFLVIEVKGWFFGKKVLAGPSLISRVDWANSTIHVNANCQALKNAQEYKPAA